MQKTTKKAIDLVVPSLLAFATGGYFIYKKEDRSVKFLIMVMILVFVLSYAVTTQITKAIIINGEKPDPVKGTGDTSSNLNSVTGGVSSFDAPGWVDRVKKDVYASFSVRDAELYEKMISFGNDDLINMWNLWNDKYFTEYGETMTEAIDSEYPVPFSDVWRNMKNIVSRLKLLGCK
jgi:hypothetical protein